MKKNASRLDCQPGRLHFILYFFLRWFLPVQTCRKPRPYLTFGSTGIGHSPVAPYNQTIYITTTPLVFVLWFSNFEGFLFLQQNRSWENCSIGKLSFACRPIPKVFGDFALFKTLFAVGIVLSLDLSISHWLAHLFSSGLIITQRLRFVKCFLGSLSPFAL